jgi:acyl-CoA thioesterase
MRLPFVDHVGIHFAEHGEGFCVALMPVQPYHLNGNAVVHGGALFTLADTCMGSALYLTLDRSQSCATVEIKINYFKPALSGELRCRSEIVHKGRSLANLDASIWSGDVLVAKANGSFAIFDRRPAPAAARDPEQQSAGQAPR